MSNVDLTSMTKNELLSFAAENGIDGLTSKDTKSTIVETIEAAL